MARAVSPLLLLAALAGCDDATVITHVDKYPHMTLDDLWTMQDPQGIPVEIHGNPFSRGTDQALAEALQAPTGAQDVKFYARPVGAVNIDHGWRLVLHFNPFGAPNSPHDCKHTAEVRTGPPKGEGFEVNATFCEGTKWQAHGYLQALEVQDGDVEGYTRVMRTLFQAIFFEEPEDR